MKWRFEIYPDGGGHYRWRLVADNGEKVASSGESFASKSNAMRAAENVREKTANADVVEVKE